MKKGTKIWVSLSWAAALLWTGFPCTAYAAEAQAAGPARGKVVKTVYETEDVVIAAYDVTDFGAAGDGKTDDTAAFQKALNACGTAGGGVVYVPNGTYALRENLNIPNGVTLRGDWNNPDKAQDGQLGSLLQAYAGRGKTDGNAFITLNESSGIKGISIAYPEQSAENIVPYPFTIRQAGRDSATVENVTLVNSYQGIITGPDANELFSGKNIYGTPLKTGFTRDQVFDVGRLKNVRFSYVYWVKAGLANSPQGDQIDTLRQWLYENAVAFEIPFPAWTFFYDIAVDNYHTAFQTKRSIADPAKRGPNGGVYNLDVKNCRIGVELGDNNENGFYFTNGSIQAKQAVIGLDVYKAVCDFSSLTFDGEIANNGSGVFSFNNCSFADLGGSYNIAMHQGSLLLSDCAFGGAENHIFLGPNTLTAQIRGYTCSGKLSVENRNPNHAAVQIDSTPLGHQKADQTYDEKLTAPRPIADKLFIVTDYGASGDGVAENDAAFRRALDAAKNAGGGTVWVPCGEFVLKKQLVIPSGVELRGTFDVAHHTEGNTGSQLFLYAGKNLPDGEAAISLQQGAGLRGITLYYPEQSVSPDSFIPYAYTIRADGKNVWVKDVVMVNSYAGADFASHDCAGCLIDDLSGCALHTGIELGYNTGEGWIQNVHLMPHYWVRSTYANKPESAEAVREYTLKNLTIFEFGYNNKINALHNFGYGAATGIRFVKQKANGQLSSDGLTRGTFIANGIDGTAMPLVIDDIGRTDFINTQLVSMTNADKRQQITINNTAAPVVFYVTLLWGQPTRMIEVNGGQVTFTQLCGRKPGDASLCVNGGTAEAANCHFNPASRVINIQPGAQKASVGVSVFSSDKPEEAISVPDNGENCLFSYFVNPIGKTANANEAAAKSADPQSGAEQEAAAPGRPERDIAQKRRLYGALALMGFTAVACVFAVRHRKPF